MAEIIRALDTTLSDISTIRVYPLVNAYAADTAAMISQLFSGQNASRRAGRRNDKPIRRRQPFRRSHRRLTIRRSHRRRSHRRRSRRPLRSATDPGLKSDI